MWWETTIAHFKALIERKNAATRQENFRFGLIASVVHNTKLDKKQKSKAKEPLEWFGEGKAKSGAGNKTMEKQKLAAMNWAKELGGEVKL